MGYIQSFFVNFWNCNKPIRVRAEEVEDIIMKGWFTLLNYIYQVNNDDFILDDGTEEEIIQIQEWLKCNRAPPQKVFEKLNQTFYTRKEFIKVNTFSCVILNWPRLFDIDGAVSVIHIFLFHTIILHNLSRFRMTFHHRTN
jgi:hypothetical protein